MKYESVKSGYKKKKKKIKVIKSLLIRGFRKFGQG